ncbi:MAG TPA: Yip1 family protein [Chitinophagaceae bacterium]|nr:Yip1 family protein [Chitinophagaceae bacterium]
MDQQSNQSVPPPPPTVQHKGINLVDRAKNILITPIPEWAVIDKDPANNATIFTTYILPLLLIGAFASFLGFGFIGIHGLKAGAGGGAVRGLIFVAFTAVLVFAMAAAIDVLAPSFGSEKNWSKSFKLAAYSLTAAYLGAIFWLFPALWILVLLCSLYSLYALYTGIPVLKKTTADKQIAYFAVILLITVVLAILLNLLMTEIAKAFQPDPMAQYRRLLGQ